MAKKAVKKVSLMDRLKEKAKEVEERKEERAKGGFDIVPMFKPKEGDQIVRILPHWDDPDNKFYFVEKVIHYIPKKLDDGRKVNIPVACLEEFDEECPICQAVVRLRAADKKDEDAKNIRKQRKALYNIIDYQEKAVVVWAVPETLHEDFMTWLGDAGEFWSLEAGRNWKLKKKVDPKRGPISTTYKIFPDMKESAVPSKLEGELDNMFNLDEVWSENGKETMLEALDLLGIDYEGEEKPAPRKGAKAKAKPPVKRKAKPAEEDVEEIEEDVEEIEDEVSPEELGIETGGDDDLEDELRRLGVK